MTIYKTKRNKNYRKVYIEHFGSIPKEENGRSYDIHHIDGNPFNDDPSNLIALTIQEHYDIHYSQQDWGACMAIAARMKISPKEKSRLSSLNNLERISLGTHPFTNSEYQSMVAKIGWKSGAHDNHIKLNSIKSKDLLEKGIHNFQLMTKEQLSNRSKRNVEAQLKNGTHAFLTRSKESYKESNKRSSQTRISAGTAPHQITKMCEKCGATINALTYGRYHGQKCRY